MQHRGDCKHLILLLLAVCILFTGQIRISLSSMSTSVVTVAEFSFENATLPNAYESGPFFVAFSKSPFVFTFLDLPQDQSPLGATLLVSVDAKAQRIGSNISIPGCVGNGLY